MFSILLLPSRILNVLEANVSSREIAAGVCLALFMGLIPMNGPMMAVLVIFFFVFQLNRVSTLLTVPLFKLVYILGVYKLTDMIGSYLLIDADYLMKFWRIVTHIPVVALLDLNNTLVAGGLALGVVLCAPVYFISKAIAGAAQNKYAEKFKDHKIIKFYKKVQKAQSAANIVQKVKDKLLDGEK